MAQNKAISLLKTVANMAADLEYDIHQVEADEAITLYCNLAPHSPVSIP